MWMRIVSKTPVSVDNTEFTHCNAQIEDRANQGNERPDTGELQLKANTQYRNMTSLWVPQWSKLLDMPEPAMVWNLSPSGISTGQMRIPKSCGGTYLSTSSLNVGVYCTGKGWETLRNWRKLTDWTSYEFAGLPHYWVNQSEKAVRTGLNECKPLTLKPLMVKQVQHGLHKTKEF